MARPKQNAAAAARRVRLDGGHATAIVEFPKPLFMENDIPVLFDGIALLPGADPVGVAALLDTAVRHAMTVQGHEDQKLSFIAERDVFRNIENRAIGLLEALGYSTEWDKNADRVLTNFAGLIRFGEVPGLSGDMPEEQREAAAVALLALPEAIANLIKLATHSANARGERSKRGDRAEHFGPILFGYFCAAWEAAVGSLPVGRINGEAPDEVLCGLVRRLTIHAADQMAGIGDTSRSAALLRSLAAKSSATIASNIDAAVRQHRTFRRKLQGANGSPKAAEKAGRMRIDRNSE